MVARKSVQAEAAGAANVGPPATPAAGFGFLGHAILRFDGQPRGKPRQRVPGVIGCIEYPGQVAEQRGDLADHLCGLVVGAR